MNSKIIVAVVVLVLIMIAAYLFTTTPLSTAPSTGPTPTAGPTDVTTATSELSSVIGDEYSVLIQDELNKLSIEQTDFNNQIQDSMVSDLSQFYYQ